MSALTRTRRTLQGIAEHILAAHGRRSGGSIRLFVTVRGFETRPPGGDILALADGVLHRRPAGPTVELAGTFQRLADGLGVPFGLPPGLVRSAGAPGAAGAEPGSDPPYLPVSGCRPGDPIVIDPDALTTLVDAWARGAQALRLIAGRYRLREREPALWPEHLNVTLTVAGVPLGVSAGDDRCEEPYAYLAGARRPMRELPDVDAVLSYFDEGLAASDSTASRSRPSSFTRSRTP